jgi:hypothetical protein
VIEQEMARRFHSDLNASFCVEIRRQKTTGEDGESYCVCNGELEIV